MDLQVLNTNGDISGTTDPFIKPTTPLVMQQVQSEQFVPGQKRQFTSKVINPYLKYFNQGDLQTIKEKLGEDDEDQVINDTKESPSSRLQAAKMMGPTSQEIDDDVKLIHQQNNVQGLTDTPQQKIDLHNTEGESNEGDNQLSDNDSNPFSKDYKNQFDAKANQKLENDYKRHTVYYYNNQSVDGQRKAPAGNPDSDEDPTKKPDGDHGLRMELAGNKSDVYDQLKSKKRFQNLQNNSPYALYSVGVDQLEEEFDEYMENGANAEQAHPAGGGPVNQGKGGQAQQLNNAKFKRMFQRKKKKPKSGAKNDSGEEDVSTHSAENLEAKSKSGAKRKPRGLKQSFQRSNSDSPDARKAKTNIDPKNVLILNDLQQSKNHSTAKESSPRNLDSPHHQPKFQRSNALVKGKQSVQQEPRKKPKKKAHAHMTQSQRVEHSKNALVKEKALIDSTVQKQPNAANNLNLLDSNKSKKSQSNTNIIKNYSNQVILPDQKLHTLPDHQSGTGSNHKPHDRIPRPCDLTQLTFNFLFCSGCLRCSACPLLGANLPC